MPGPEIKDREINTEISSDEEMTIQPEADGSESTTENSNDVEFTNMYTKAALEKYAGKMSLKNDLIMTIHDTKRELETLKDLNSLSLDEHNKKIEQLDALVPTCLEKLAELESDTAIKIDKKEIDTLKLEIDSINNEKEALKNGLKSENEYVETLKDIGLFMENFDDKKFLTWESIYNDEKARELIFKLLEFDGIQVEGIGGSNDLENLINQYKSQKGIQSENIKEIYISLTDNFYRKSLNKWMPYMYFKAPFRRLNGESEDESAFIKEKAFVCLEGLERIGTLEESELQEKYLRIYSKDLKDLGFKDIDDLKNDMGLDTIAALEYAKEYGEQANESKQSNGIKTETIQNKYNGGDVYAPGAYSKMLWREKDYFNYISEKKGSVLSLEDYNKLFGNLYKNSQGGLGDCYLITVIRGLARTEYFDILIRTSFQVNEDGSYTVRFPLGEPEGKEITVTQEELKESAVSGADGYKVIELAYAKFITKNNTITSAEQMEQIESSTGSLALKILLGREGYDVDTYYLKLDREVVRKRLKEYNPRNGDVITFSRLTSDKKDRLPNKHAMIVTDVHCDSNGNLISVQIENPWNSGSGSQKVMPIDDFLDFAQQISFGSITSDFMNTSTSDRLEPQQDRDVAFSHITRVPDAFGDPYSSWWSNNKNNAVSWKSGKEFIKATGNSLWDGFGELGQTCYYLGKSGYGYTKIAVEKARDATSNFVSDKRHSFTNRLGF